MNQLYSIRDLMIFRIDTLGNIQKKAHARLFTCEGHSLNCHNKARDIGVNQLIPDAGNSH